MDYVTESKKIYEAEAFLLFCKKLQAILDTQNTKLEQICVEYICDIYPEEIFVAILNNDFKISDKDIAVILNELNKVEKKLSSNTPNPPTKTPESEVKGTAVETNVKRNIENITPLRTLEGDMKRVHGYGAIAAANADRAATPTHDGPDTTEANDEDITPVDQVDSISETDEEIVHKSTQADSLQRPPLSELPSYEDKG